MKSTSFLKITPDFSNNIDPGGNSKELWSDILVYSSNLSGNWLLSKHIFYVKIVPAAEKNPAQFARRIKEMVKRSGIKIKSRAEFIAAINFLRKLHGKSNKTGIKQALYQLFNSGLKESAYAYQALENSA